MKHAFSPCVNTLGNRLGGLNVTIGIFVTIIIGFGGDCTGWVNRHSLPLSIRAPTSCIISINTITLANVIGYDSASPDPVQGTQRTLMYTCLITKSLQAN